MKLCNGCRRHVRPGAGACPFCGEVLRTTGAGGLGAVVLLGALGAGCTSRPVLDSATDASSEAGTGTSSGTTQGGGMHTSSSGPATTTAAITSTTTADTTMANTSTGELSTGNDVDTNDPGCSFYGGCPPDFGGSKWCDPWTQDCPPGEKCMPYSGDGDTSWESLGCFPVVEDPGKHGEPCTVEGSGVSGIDSCDVAHMCWNVDPDTGMGTCVAFCTGSPDAPVCEVPKTACTISGAGVLILCLPTCDPILQDCAENDVCISHRVDPDSFTCVPDASGEEGQEFDPCEYANACDPGLFCGDPEVAVECDPMWGCCIAYCDLGEPTCSGQGAECLPWYEPGMAPLDYAHVGYCGLPE